MSAPFDRDRFVREARFSVGTMFVVVVVYGAVIAWVWSPKGTHLPPATLLTAEGILGAIGATCLVTGLIAWRAMPTAKMLALAARKQGKAEREPGWPPRAIAFKNRAMLITTLLEGPAMVGVVSRVFGAPLWEALCYVLASALSVGWLWLALPRKAHQVMG